MSFTSLFFYLALFPAGIIFYLLPTRARALYLLALSLAFYALSGPIYLLLLLAATALVYGCGRKIAAGRDEQVKKVFLLVGAGVIVAMIVCFKAAGAFQGVLLPLGLSYYSFKLIAYIVEVYWDDEAVEKDFVLFALYAAFFPQIVSGPIQRPYDFLSQVRRAVAQPADNDRIEEGYRLILGGLLMKLLIGDRLGAFIDIVDKSPSDYQWLVLLTVAVCYTLQLYADFSGYTNIAIGIGKIFGIDSPPNFNAPFAATNIQQMWQRWHMSLTTWLRDYLFIPLNFAFRDYGKSGMIGAVVVNMVVIGLWHGLTMNFLIFGLCHAFFLSITILTTNARGKIFGSSHLLNFFGSLAGVVLTFGMMTFSAIFFQANSLTSAVTHLNLLFFVTPSGALNFSDIRSDVVEPLFVCMAIAYFVSIGAPGMKRIGQRLRLFIPNWVEYGFALLLISSLTVESGATFIYGQF